MFFVATEQGEAMNLVNAKYGNTPGLKYSHVSDQYAVATQVIPATASEAPILDGLLMNDADAISEQFTDTAASPITSLPHVPFSATGSLAHPRPAIQTALRVQSVSRPGTCER